MKTKIIDCTIRDGGHLNGWNFNENCVKASYYAAVKCGIDYFEIGYRFHNVKPDWGKFAKCKDVYLKNLFNEAKLSCKLAIMINAGEGLVQDFKPCKEEYTPIRAIRVATYPTNLNEAISHCEKFKKLGYETFLNLMTISMFTNEHFRKLEKWRYKDILECVTFADSFGSFVPNDIIHYIKIIETLGFKKIGFHSHNNLQLAFANSLKAVEYGAYCVDASIFGMGRGSGNLPIEIFTSYLNKISRSNIYNPVAYIDVISRFYIDLMKQYNWGYRLESLIGGINNIHPYYVDELFFKKGFTVNEIWNAAELVAKCCPISYSLTDLENILEDKFVCYDNLPKDEQLRIIPEADAPKTVDDIEYKDIVKGRKVLVLASGPSTEKYKKQIQDFIKEENCVIIATNHVVDGYNPKFHVFASRRFFLENVNDISKKSIVLVPSFFGKKIIEENCPQNKYMHFDVSISNEERAPIFDKAKHVYSGLNGAISGLFLAYQMGACEIYAAGLDGFGMDNNNGNFYGKITTEKEKESYVKTYKNIAEDLRRFNKFLEEHKIFFSIITPTSHTDYYRKIRGL
jgi:4-hydroxy 2-oxovalerate aldolase